MGWYQDHLYSKLLAESLRTLDVDEDLKQFLQLIAEVLDDRDSEIRSVSDIWDIDRCPARYLPYIGQLVGWLFGPEDTEAQMRSQLKLAIPFYRKKGLEEAFRILCYSYGFFVDVVPLWSNDYNDFRPRDDDPTFSTSVVAEVVFTGSAVATSFLGRLLRSPIRRSSLTVTAGSVVGVDQGDGTIQGPGVTGNIIYGTGAISLMYLVAPGAGVDVVADYDETTDDPPLSMVHPDLGGTGDFYPTPHVGVDLVGFVDVPTFGTFTYMIERIHDIRPAHVVIAWFRYMVEAFDFITIADEDGLGEIDLQTRDTVPWPGCFWRGRGCLFPFYRNGTITNRRGPGGFYPVQDYTAGYPPSADDPTTSGVVDILFSDPTVNLEPDPGNPMPDDPVYGYIHVRDPDLFCDQPTRSSFDYDVAYHLRDGSSWMRRNTPRPPGPHYFRDGQGLERCGGDNIPWLGPVPWGSQYHALAGSPDVEAPPWAHVPPGASPPIVGVSGGVLSVSHDYDAGELDAEGWELVSPEPLGTVNLESGYTFDLRVQIPLSPPTYASPGSSVPLTITVVGSRPSVPESRSLVLEVFSTGIRNGVDGTMRIDHDFTAPTLLRAVLVEDLVVLHVDGRRVLYARGDDWFPVVVASERVDFIFGPMAAAGHQSAVEVEWVRLLVDAVAFGPGRDYWTEYNSRTWDGWCCPPDDPLPGSPLRWYCCQEDTLSVESADPLGIIELGGPILYLG